MNFILVHAFSPEIAGHGGNKRSYQVREAFGVLGATQAAYVFRDPDRSMGIVQLCILVVLGYFWQLRFGMLSIDPKVALLVGNSLRYMRNLVRKHGHQFTLVWEGSVSSNWFLGTVAKSQGISVIALPQNLDSLVSMIKQPFLWSRGRWLEFEMTLYRRCDLVLGISHEDVWLMRLHGVNAQWWPYQARPASDAASTPREAQGYCLTFGTALNAPTAEGMRAVGRAFREHLPNIPLKIAGRGTDTLGNDDDFLTSECLGEVSDSRLNELIHGAICVVVHQQPATGALTRLVDLDAYGIPVLCNIDAYRSAHLLRNSYCYSSDEELAELVKGLTAQQELPILTDALDLGRLIPILATVHGNKPVRDVTEATASVAR